MQIKLDCGENAFCIYLFARLPLSLLSVVDFLFLYDWHDTFTNQLVQSHFEIRQSDSFDVSYEGIGNYEKKTTE